MNPGAVVAANGQSIQGLSFTAVSDSTSKRRVNRLVMMS